MMMAIVAGFSTNVEHSSKVQNAIAAPQKLTLEGAAMHRVMPTSIAIKLALFFPSSLIKIVVFFLKCLVLL